MDGASDRPQRNVASLAYRVGAGVAGAYDFQKTKFAALNWKELPGASVTAEYASGTFSGGGYFASVTVMPSGSGQAEIMIKNHGNVDLTQLPLPQGTTATYVGPLTAMHVAGTPVAETADACAKLLIGDGWEPYGAAGTVAYFKRGQVRLTLSVGEAPAQGGKTMISFTSELMGADLPAPASATGIEYSDSTQRLGFETSMNQEELEGYYREILKKSGWTTTMEKPVEGERGMTLAFRNSSKDMVTVAMAAKEGGGTKVILQLETAAALDEMNRRLDAQAAAHLARQKAAAAEARLKMALPADAAGLKKSPGLLSFTLAGGQGRAAADQLLTQLAAAGWQETSKLLEPVAGNVIMNKDGKTLTLTYTDTGVLPAEVSVSAPGVVFE
jgi:hypothetical protein